MSLKNKILYTSLGAIIFALVSYFLQRSNNITTAELALNAQVNLHKKESFTKEALNQIAIKLKHETAKDVFLKFENKFPDFYKNEGVSFYIYQNDSLCFWTDNQPAVDLNNYTNEESYQLVKIRNGWFELIRDTLNTDKRTAIVALIAIKNEYDFENNYLENNFSTWLQLPDKTKLITPIKYFKHAITSKYGKPLFEIYRADGIYKNGTKSLIASVFAVLSLLLISLNVLLSSKIIIKNRILRLVFIIGFCFIIRTIMVYFKVPDCFYLTDLYNVRVFADASSFFFSFLGDALINSFLLFIVSVYIYKNKLHIIKSSLLINSLWLIFFLLILAGFTYNFPRLIFSLINNSTISFNINQLFEFSLFTLVGLLSVGFMIFSFYMLLEVFVILIIQNFKKQNVVVLISVFCITIYVITLLILKLNKSEFLWPIPFLVTSYLLRRFKATNNFINVGLIVLIATFIVNYFFSNYNELNKKQTYSALSFSLTDREDAIAENEFSKVSLSIKNDINLKNLISLLPLSSQKIEQKIKQVNFTDYFERYDIILSLFRNEAPVFNFSESKYLSVNYFEDQINDGERTLHENLFFINKKNKPIRYIGKIEIIDPNLQHDSAYFLYVQLDPKLSSSLGVFPEILLDKSLQSKIVSQEISYAIYENNKLQSSHGNIQYPIFFNHNAIYTNENSFTHYVYNGSNHQTIIISDVKTSFWQVFASNSYLFIFFSLIVIIAVWFNALIIRKNRKFKSLNNRIQFILVSIIVLSLVSVVVGTVWVVTTQFENKNKNELILKSKSILNELQQSIGQQNVLEGSYKEYSIFSLKKLAQLFGTDITLFDKKGVLYATSQPAIYEQGLVSKFMNPYAYSGFLLNRNAALSHRETIGSLNYLSTYIPFYNSENKLLGYLNLPYFSRQKDLEKELSVYLTTLLNIYTVLFVITTLIALFVSNLLTKPLRIIKNQISNTKFGSTITPIEWESNDEIGSLVNEYNLMLIELEKSTELLAKSERESAWREMSKQVAHEIKNPLTPMKLNIQHLQRVVKTNPEDISDRVDKVADMLIQQIDTLTNIANEFSNFGKFPITKLEKIDLVIVLQNLINLFKKLKDRKLDLIVADSNLYSMVDKEQFIRAITNLIKNADQSISENKFGFIKIKLSKIDGNIEIRVSDNGTGIPLEVYPKIFVPNFTTKNSGTGLGLAMVKNSIVTFNGSIRFESEVGVGTTFIILLPSVD